MYTNITLVWIELNSDPLSKIPSLNLVKEKNVIEIKNFTKSGQPYSPTEISYRQSQ